jgi:two-component system cell cycle sensor histidine kinase/response regulator CckA
MNFEAYRDTILIVDDNLEIRACAQAFLEHAGYSVATAADGEDGFRYYETHRSNVVLLLTDVKMPNMNGLELADRVLGLDSQLPVLFMSGDARGADRGFGCVVKPFKSAELVARVNQALDAKTPFRDIGRPRLAPQPTIDSDVQ